MLTFFFWKWVFYDVTKGTNTSPIEVTAPLVSCWLRHLLWFPLILVEIAIKCQF